MENDIFSAVAELLQISCKEIFQHFGCDIRCGDWQGAPDEIPDGLLGQIDAGNNDLEISLSLVIPYAVLALSYPGTDMGIDMDDATLEAWLPELSNQLMGRLKNKIVGGGAILKLGLPYCQFDAGAEPLVNAQGTRKFMPCEVDGELIEIGLALKLFNPALEFSLADAKATDNMEGGVQFF